MRGAGNSLPGLGVSMQSEHRAVLSLVAMGRITAEQAERLLAAANDSREALGIVAVCAIVCLAQVLSHLDLQSIGHFAHALIAAGPKALLHAASTVVNRMGGSL